MPGANGTRGAIMSEKLPSLRWWLKWLLLLSLATAALRYVLTQGTIRT